MNRSKRGTSTADEGDRLFSGLLLGVGLVFYVFFALYDGVIIAVDSASYITMDVSREPLYPMLLAAFRALIPSDDGTGYLNAVVMLQSILAALSAWIMARYLQKTFHLPRVMTLLVWFIPLAVSLLCRFAAGRSSMYSNSILTEGICIPLYLIFFRWLLEYALEHTRISVAWCLSLSFIMYAMRQQMLAALALWMIAAVVRAWMDRRVVRGLAAALCGALLVIGGSACLDLGYNYVLRGEAMTHTGDSRFLTTMAVYIAEREDAQYIEDEGAREVFLEVYDASDAQGFLMNSAGEGWLTRVTHFGDCYTTVQIEILWPAASAWAVDFAQAIGCRNLVFGCPRNRCCPEGTPWETGVRFFRMAGEYAAEHHAVIGMEANPPIYHTNYINDTLSALCLIEEVDSAGFMLNLDVGTMIANGESVQILAGKVPRISHVHISEPQLALIQKRELHTALRDVLASEGYNGWISIEMGRQESAERLKRTMEYVAGIFG